jgi:hypothetical protein
MEHVFKFHSDDIVADLFGSASYKFCQTEFDLLASTILSTTAHQSSLKSPTSSHSHLTRESHQFSTIVPSKNSDSRKFIFRAILQWYPLSVPRNRIHNIYPSKCTLYDILELFAQPPVKDLSITRGYAAQMHSSDRCYVSRCQARTFSHIQFLYCIFHSLFHKISSMFPPTKSRSLSTRNILIYLK